MRPQLMRHQLWCSFVIALALLSGNVATADELQPVSQHKTSAPKTPTATATQTQKSGSLLGQGATLTVMEDDPLLTGQQNVERARARQPQTPVERAPARSVSEAKKPIRTIRLPESAAATVVNDTDKFLYRDLTERDAPDSADGELAGLPLEVREQNANAVRRQAAAAKQGN